MLYDNYRKKILQRAAALRQALRLVPVMAAVLVILLSSFVTFALAKGTVTHISFTNHLEYGSTPAYEAAAFFGEAHFEYSSKGAEAWSQEAPSLPGEYDVRVVSEGIFGNRYKYIDVLRIFPKRIDVTVEGGTVVYGEKPVAAAKLGKGDRIVCENFVYESEVLANTRIKADSATVKILNSAGEDITYAYEIDTPYSDVTITPKELIIYVSHAVHEYDGNEFSYNVYEIGEGALMPGESVQAKFDKTITDVGSVKNTPVVTVVNKNGADVTHFYNISEREVGNLIVTQRPLHIITGSAVYEYNGEAQSCPEYTLDNATELLEGHRISVNGSASRELVGTAQNSMSFSVFDTDGNDVTANYSIIVTEGTIEITKRKITVTTGSNSWEYDGEPHSHTEYTLEGTVFGTVSSNISNITYINDVGVAENSFLISIFGGTADVTENYDISYVYGKLEVTKRPITVKTGSFAWIYDAEPHVATEEINLSCELKAGELVNGHIFAYESEMEINKPSITNVGTIENKSTLRIKAGTKDVTANYDITYEYGTLTIYPLPITIYPKAAEKIYDGTPLYATEIEFGMFSNELAKDTHMLEYSIEGSRVNVNDTDVSVLREVKITENGEDITYNYDITLEEGKLTVLPRPVTVSSGSAEKIYDGTPLTNNEFSVPESSGYALVEGHRIECIATGSQTEVGESENTFNISDVMIYGADGADVSYNYTVAETVFGTLKVSYQAEIYIESASASKFYDGTPLTNPNYKINVTAGEIKENHTVYVAVTGSITEVGVAPNTIESVAVYDESGKDVSYMYGITIAEGELTVEKILANFTVYSMNDAKVYDGTPLTNSKYTISVSEGAIDASHRVEVTITGTITEIGTAPNTIESVFVYDENGADVSYMYTINTSEGTLKIEERNDSEMDTETVFLKLKAEKPGLIYLKMKSYGDYNLRGFNDAMPYTTLIDGKYNASYFTPIALMNAGYTANNVEITDALIYMLPYYASVNGTYGMPVDDVNVAGTYSLSAYNVPYFTIDSYSNKLAGLQGNLGEYAAAELEYRGFVYGNYLAIDAETNEFMQALIAENGFNINDADIITKVARYIQTAADYNLNYSKSLDSESNVAVAFLRNYKQGICVHYATAATMLYRALGIPARYVEGFMVDAQADTVIEVKNPGHAWVEIYIDGVGWVQVEVTGGDYSSGSGSGGEGTKEPIVIKPSYLYKKYDGTPLDASVNNEIVITEALQELLDKGYTYEVKLSGAITLVGRTESYISSFVLRDADGVDVTKEYPVKLERGTLEILRADTKLITVYLYETKKVYDGTPIVIGDYDYEIIEGGDGVTLDIDFVKEIINAGRVTLTDLNSNLGDYIKYTVMRDGSDVTSEYDVRFDVFEDMDASTYVPIEITRRKITLTAASATKVYDGQGLENRNASITFGTLADGDKLDATAFGRIVSVGTEYNEPVVRGVYNAGGEDVTDNYEFKLVDGILTVLPEE